MDDSVQPLLPVPSCVVFGRRRAASKAMPDTVRAFSGALPYRDAPEEIADKKLKVCEGAPALAVAFFEGGSTYRSMFRNGATLFPRMLILVEHKTMGRLGGDPSAPYVASRPSKHAPWRELPSIENRVETEFLRPVLLGESILPYRLLRTFKAVVPVTDKGEVLDAEGAAKRGYEGLHGWMSKVEKLWKENAESGSMILVNRWNYHNELGAQFPLAALRVIYSKAGTNPAACVLRGGRAMIEHTIYWAAFPAAEECHYLSAILNCETARTRYGTFQARGQFGARHFDKVMFNLPIPRSDAKYPLHTAIAEAAREAEAIAAAAPLPGNIKFQRARGLVRAALQEAGLRRGSTSSWQSFLIEHKDAAKTLVWCLDKRDEAWISEVRASRRLLRKRLSMRKVCLCHPLVEELCLRSPQKGSPVMQRKNAPHPEERSIWSASRRTYNV